MVTGKAEFCDEGHYTEMRAEISYDLVMDDDMAFVEGTHRLPGGDWQVVIVSAPDRDVPAPEVVPQRCGGIGDIHHSRNRC